MPAQKLAAKLQSWLPGDLDYTFFSDSGSVAVEVALKMALQYAINRGEAQRTMVLALEPVSYTHLDVYKRQPEILVGLRDRFCSLAILMDTG